MARNRKVEQHFVTRKGTSRTRVYKQVEPSTSGPRVRVYPEIDFRFVNQPTSHIVDLARKVVLWPTVQHLKDARVELGSTERHLKESDFGVVSTEAIDDYVSSGGLEFSNGQGLQFNKDSSPSTANAFQLVLSAWRRLVPVLTTPKMIVRRQIMGNCLPSLIAFSTGSGSANLPSIPCNLWAICPWCAGRYVTMVGKTVGLYNEESFADLFKRRAVTVFQHSSKIVVDNDADKKDCAFLNRVTFREQTDCVNLRLKNRFDGLIWNTRLGFDLSELKPLWCINTVVVAVHSPRLKLESLPPYWSSETFVNPSQTQMEEVVSFCTKYRPEVLTTDPKLVRASLNARKDMRLMGCSGVLRLRKQLFDYVDK